MKTTKIKTPAALAQAKEHATDLVDLREQAANANEQGMNEVLKESGLVIDPSRMRGWRVTKRTPGHILGVAGNLTCIATDGNLGIFVQPSGFALWGHVQHFVWDEVQEILLKVKDEFGEDKFIKREVGKGPPPPKFGTASEASVYKILDKQLKGQKVPRARKATEADAEKAAKRATLLASL